MKRRKFLIGVTAAASTLLGGKALYGKLSSSETELLAENNSKNPLFSAHRSHRSHNSHRSHRSHRSGY